MRLRYNGPNLGQGLVSLNVARPLGPCLVVSVKDNAKAVTVVGYCCSSQLTVIDMQVPKRPSEDGKVFAHPENQEPLACLLGLEGEGPDKATLPFDDHQ
jgi:hypothetical protein